jgi:hypothetical protein
MRAFMPLNSRSKFLFLLVILAVFFSSFFKIADLDFWWHLKTGEIIVKEKAFQHHEIYSFTANGREYIDHEWLFQVLQYFTFNNFGSFGIILLKIAVILTIYLLLMRFLIKEGIPIRLAVAILLFSICGARSRFIERPEIFTILLLLSCYILIDSYLKKGHQKSIFLILLLIPVWSNIHAAVILGLLLQVIFLLGILMEKLIQRSYPVFYDAQKKQIYTLIAVLIASTLLTGFNPYGYRLLKVPFELTAIIDSGLLKNQEWQHPSPWNLPFFYICLIVTLLLNVFNFRRLHIVNFLLTAFLGYVSLKYVRNVGLFCMMMPVLISPYAASLAKSRILPGIALVTSMLMLLFNLFNKSIFEFGTGKASYFPEKIVHFTKRENLKGHMINSYGFGGYLIWTLFPERKVFIDGRNEVYLPLLEKLHESVTDSRKWYAILKEYEIEYALLNYVDDMEIVTVMTPGEKPVITYAPFTSTHFPRSGWALVYFDDTGMILIKRAGINQQLVSKEYASVFPEGIDRGESYAKFLVRSGKLSKGEAIRDLERKLVEDPECRRAERLLKEIRAFE